MHFRIPGFMTLLYRNMYIDEIRWDNEMDTQFQYVKWSLIHLSADKMLSVKLCLQVKILF